MRKDVFLSINTSVTIVLHAPDSLEKSLVTLAVYPCAGRMQFDDV